MVMVVCYWAGRLDFSMLAAYAEYTPSEVLKGEKAALAKVHDE